MAMNQETYDSVLEYLSREPSFNEGLRRVREELPHVFDSVSEKTLKSIQAQYYVRRMRRSHHHHYSRETREKYYKLYKAAKSKDEKSVIVRLAAKNDISPCLLARIILEEYYWNDVNHGRQRDTVDGRASLPPGFMTDCIRDISKLPNPELAREIYETTVLDNFYGPSVDSIKKTCGVEYEMILKAHCKQRDILFIDEEQMRLEGYDKTPDVRLKVPIMINNRVVNWIESKASFGDPINHQQYMIDQFMPYKNRFGPGAVIYWFGFVKELAETGERGILLLDKFPAHDEILKLEDFHEPEAQTFGVDWFWQKDKEHRAREATSGEGKLEDDKYASFVDPMFDSDSDCEDGGACTGAGTLPSAPDRQMLYLDCGDSKNFSKNNTPLVDGRCVHSSDCGDSKNFSKTNTPLVDGRRFLSSDCGDSKDSGASKHLSAGDGNGPCSDCGDSRDFNKTRLLSAEVGQVFELGRILEQTSINETPFESNISGAHRAEEEDARDDYS